MIISSKIWQCAYSSFIASIVFFFIPIHHVNSEVPQFSEVSELLQMEKRSRRKWDGPIVADFDGNGYQDLILTEHGYRVDLLWNDRGIFSKSTTLVSGDMHGQGLGDFDNNGLIELLVSQGGGNGTNLRKPLHYEINKDRSVTESKVLEHFESGRGRSIKTFDANNDGLVDLFLTGFATPQQMSGKGPNQFYKNNGKGKFEYVAHLPFSDRLSYKSVLTDFDQNNDPDIIVFGGKKLIALEGGNEFEFNDVTVDRFGTLKDISEVSSVAQIDFDRDGDYDLALSRSEHQFENEAHFDPDNRTFAFFSRFLSFKLEDLKVEGDLRIENLQMAYPHFDVFVGKEKRNLVLKNRNEKLSYDNDSHELQDIVISPVDAKGWPEEICKKNINVKYLPKEIKPGLYIGHIGDGYWRICSLTQSPTAAVIHNVLSEPNSTEDEPYPVMLLENRNGKFFDVTSEKGIAVNEQTTGAVSADFNNDGWDDLFFVRYGSMATHNKQILYLNKKGHGFERIKNHGIISMELGATGSGAEAIDYDRDGDLDLVYANERGQWHLFRNNNERLNTHGFVGFEVGYSPAKQATPLGAKIEIEACDRKYQNIIGKSSSSFGVSLNTHALFGLGDCDSLKYARVTWTNGESKEFRVKEINRYHLLK